MPLAAMAVALAGGLLLGLLVLRASAPAELTQPQLDEARRHWEAHGPTSYRLTVQMGGALTDRRQIEVEEGTVVRMTINDSPGSAGSLQYWSVDGMLDFLQAELRNAEDPPRSLGVTDPDQIVLRAAFDSQLGYPTHFFRHLLGRQQSTSWKVVEFQALD